MLGITVSGVPNLLSPSASVNTVMALGVALSAGCAALVIRGWGRDGRTAALGALVFGFAPLLTSIAVGYLNLVLVVIPPLVFLLLDEVLIKRRPLSIVFGAIAGCIVATTPLHTTPTLVGGGLSFVLGGVVVALFRPAKAAIPLATVMQALLSAVVAYVLVSAYPPSINTSGPRSISVSVGDNGGYIRNIIDTVINAGRGYIGGGLGMYLVGGILAIGAVEWFRRANLRWSLLPIGALLIIVLMNLFPRFSVHP